MTPVATNASLETILSYPDLIDPTSDASSHAKFISLLRRSMVGLGFFYLADSPLEREREKVLDLSRRFFDVSVEERRRIDQKESRHFSECRAVASTVAGKQAARD
jgi:isopenicillin N synthase-like dioxygenase